MYSVTSLDCTLLSKQWKKQVFTLGLRLSEPYLHKYHKDKLQIDEPYQIAFFFKHGIDYAQVVMKGVIMVLLTENHNWAISTGAYWWNPNLQHIRYMYICMYIDCLFC